MYHFYLQLKTLSPCGDSVSFFCKISRCSCSRTAGWQRRKRSCKRTGKRSGTRRSHHPERSLRCPWFRLSWFWSWYDPPSWMNYFIYYTILPQNHIRVNKFCAFLFIFWFILRISAEILIFFCNCDIMKSNVNPKQGENMLGDMAHFKMAVDCGRAEAMVLTSF